MKLKFLLENLNCPHCVNKIEEKLSKIEGIESVEINLLSQKLAVFKNKTCKVSDEQIKEIISRCEPNLKVKKIQ